MTRQGAIIGFGKIAETTHVGALQAAGLTVSAVVDTSLARCQVARRVYPEARIYHDVATLLQRETLDFVDICAPPHLHYGAACDAISAGVHVLCEKPLVLTPAHGLELARLAKLYGVVVACVHNWTHAPILSRARALAQSGALGALVRMDVQTLRTGPAAGAGDRSNWRIDPNMAGGGILFDHGWHGMSILLRTINASPRWVRGKIEKRRYRDLSVEDTSETCIEFSNGVVGSFEATWAASERANRAILHCEHGVIEVDDDTLVVGRQGVPPQREVFNEGLAAGGYRPDWTTAVVREFKRELDEPEARGRLLHEALTSLHLLMATYESSALGGTTVPMVDIGAAGLVTVRVA